MGPGKYSGMDFRIFYHLQDDQGGQECPKTVVLEDFGCLDGDLFPVPSHMIPFWNPWDHGSTQEVFPGFLDTIRMIRDIQNVLKLGFWRILGVLMGFMILKPHI